MPRPSRSHEALLALSAVGVLVLGVQAAGQQRVPPDLAATGTAALAPAALAPAAPGTTSPATAAPAAVAADRPVAVSIERLGLAEALVPLGRQSDGTLEVPADPGRVGLWEGAGPVVLAGHVDSTTGPAVFFRLRELAPGDEVVVRTSAGTRQAYVVDRVEQHAKDAFPTFEVFAGDGLRLVTCTGAFDRRAGSYRDNLVVYARPA